MATGDVTVFDEAIAYMIDGGWETADILKCAIIDDTVDPTESDGPGPKLGDYTEVTAAGSYVVGGLSLGTLGDFITEAAGLMTADSAVDPTWAQDGLNDVDAWWGLIYNDTDATDLAIAFVELGGPVDMVAGDLTITWDAAGIFTIT